MRFRKHRRNLTILLVVVFGLTAAYESVWGAFRHTFGTEVKITQIRAKSEADEDQPSMDKRIPSSMRRALKRRFRSKYERYSFLSKEVR